MMKFIGIALTALALTACLPKDEVVDEPKAKPTSFMYDDRNSLSISFENDELGDLLTIDEFAIYTQAIKFMADDIGLGSSLEWTGPAEVFGGRIEVKQVAVDGTVTCKAFSQVLTHESIKYSGQAKVCSDGNYIVVKKLD